MKYIIIILLFIIMLQSCKENLITPESVSITVSIESIIPNHPLKVGEKFKIIVKVENLDTAKIDHRFYIDDQYHYDNYVKKDTIFTYVPYIPSTSNKWILKVSAYTYNGIDFTDYYGKDTIDVVPENCVSNLICIKWIDIDSIYEYDSFYHPEYYGDQYKWTCETNDDTITIIQVTPGCDEGYEEVRLKLLNIGNNILPEFISLTKFVYCFGSVWGDTLTSGIIKIQDYNTSGIISGIILSELKPTPSYKPDLPTRRVFWFNFNN
ncbi:MAG: hypothetical protein HXY50_11460 [Ignavibacteriaceae bacterium]|nr:hypothetical protein [Ignavibacteriaceae bacterium]